MLFQKANNAIPGQVWTYRCIVVCCGGGATIPLILNHELTWQNGFELSSWKNV